MKSNLITARLQQEYVERHCVVKNIVDHNLWRQVVVFDAQNNSVRTMLFRLRFNIVNAIDLNETQFIL